MFSYSLAVIASSSAPDYGGKSETKRGILTMALKKKSILLIAGSLFLCGSLDLNHDAQARSSQKTLKARISQEQQMADELVRKGKYNEAADLYRTALNAQPKDLNVRNGLAYAYAKSFKLDRADEEFDNVLKTDPKNAMAHCGKAQVLLNRLQSSSNTLRKNKEALLKQAGAECSMALATDPNLPEAYNILGRVYKEEGRLDKAEEAFNTAIRGDKNYSEAYSGLGMVQLDAGRAGESIAAFKQATVLNTGNSTAHYGLGRAYLKQGMVDEAIKELNTSLYQFRNSAPVHYELGKAYAAQGNMVAAIKEFQETIRIKPENASPYIKIAEIRESRGDIEHAIAELRSGMDLMPNNTELLQRIASNSLRLEKIADAIKDYESVLQKNPGNIAAAEGLTRALYLKAQKETTGAFIADNDFEAAEASIARAIQMNPDNLQLRLADAKLRSMSGKPVDLTAIGTPKNEGERVAYAEALLAQNKFAEATEQFNLLVANANDVKKLAALGDLTLMIKDLNNAESAFKKLSSMPGGQESSKRGLHLVAKARQATKQDLNLANDLSRRKQFNSAVDKYHAAIFSDPRNASARLGLAETLERFFQQDPKALRESVMQYKAYESLTPGLPQKELDRLHKLTARLELRATKMERALAQGKKPNIVARMMMR
jgi:tetratricopeptide (TPR) repeat protein